MDTRAQITKLGDLYASHKDLSHWRVSFLLRGDGQFLSRLKGGKSCMISTAEKVLTWFSENWPEDLEWPADIPRPARAPSSPDNAQRRAS